MNKAKLFYGLLFFIISLTLGSASEAHIPSTLCSVLRAANSGEFTASELCESYNLTFCSRMSMPEVVCRAGGGNFCSGVTMAQAICEAGGGSFCNNVTSETQAVCEISNGSFCSNMDPSTRRGYFEQLQACKR